MILYTLAFLITSSYSFKINYTEDKILKWLDKQNKKTHKNTQLLIWFNHGHSIAQKNLRENFFGKDCPSTCWCSAVHFMAFAGLVDDDDPDEGGSHHAAYHSDDDDACRCRLVIQTRASTTPDLHTTTFLLLTRPVNPLSTSGLYSILQCCEATWNRMCASSLLLLPVPTRRGCRSTNADICTQQHHGLVVALVALSLVPISKQNV